MKNAKMNRMAVIAVIMSLILAMTLVSCGGSEEEVTLESIVKEDKEAKAEIDKIAEETGMDISIEKNIMSYTYTYDQEIPEASRADVAKALEEAMADYESEFLDMIKELETEYDITGVGIQIQYLDSEGTLLYEAVYPK